MFGFLLHSFSIFACISIPLSLFSSLPNGDLNENEFRSFLKTIPKDSVGIVVLTNRKCEDCRKAMSMEFRDDLETKGEVYLLDRASTFGRLFSMKHRLYRIPAFILIDQNGQVLKKTFDIPENESDINHLLALEDTLPLVSEPLRYAYDYPDFLVKSFSNHNYKSPSAAELSDYFDTTRFLFDPIPWSVIRRFDVGENIVRKVIAEKEEFISRYGAEEVYDEFEDFLFSKTKSAIRSGGENELEEIKQLCLDIYGSEGSYRAGAYRSYYYQIKGDWESFASLGDRIASEYGKDDERLVSMARAMINSVDDQDLLARCLEWFSDEKSDSNAKIMETKAGLFFKAGDHKRAQYWAQLAVEKDPTEGQRVPLAMEILDRTK